MNKKDSINKNDLSNIIAQSADISKNSATRAVEAFIDTVTQSLKNGKDVVLMGFGSFTTSKRAARTARNPQTGEPMSIPETIVPRFKAGKKLKDELKGML